MGAIFQPSSDLSISSELLLSAVSVREDSRLVRFADQNGISPVPPTSLEKMYAGGDVSARSISLHEMPTRTVLVSSSSYEVDVDGVRVVEQSHPFQVSGRRDVTPVDRSVSPTLVSGEHLVIGRWGHRTWGHWLGELVPKIALAEAYFPGRFRFVTSIMPFRGSDDPGARNAWTSYRESLEALGVTEDRISTVPRGVPVEFEKLYMMDPVYSNGVFHPIALSVMRDRVLSGTGAAPQRLSVVSRGRSGRGIANLDAISPILDDREFLGANLGSITFSEQVEMFGAASSVVGVLGSGLTGLMFAPRGVRVLALGPEKFGDRFFYGIARARGGYYYDMRGESLGDDPKSSEFSVNATDFASCLDHLLGC